MVQTSFTLPVPPGPRAEGAALQLAAKMGIEPAMVVHSHGIGTGFTFFVVYGSVRHLVDLAEVHVEERPYPLLSPGEVNAAVKSRLRRSLVVLGACIGTDAHTVGIDAILNLKGFAGEKGLEYYRELQVSNLGAQVSVPELVRAARTARADAVLVSQVVTQKDAHLRNTRELAGAHRAEEADLGVPGEQALVAVHPDGDLGGDVAEQAERVRAVDQVAAVVRVAVRDVPAVDHGQPEVRVLAHVWTSEGTSACTR
jgi:beta-lysine 5,6-aminomutase beta subunit